MTELATELWSFNLIVTLVPPVGKMPSNSAELLKADILYAQVIEVWLEVHNVFSGLFNVPNLK